MGDTSVDAGSKYASSGPNRGNSVNFGPLGTGQYDTATAAADLEDPTLLEQADLDKLAEEFPGKTPENPWIKEQTNKQFLTQIKVSHRDHSQQLELCPYQAEISMLTSI